MCLSRVKKRIIGDNILLAHVLFASFHHQPYLSKCAIKVDFQKAYDTIDWGFIRLVMQLFGFPQKFIELIMICVTSPKFSIAINGEIHDLFSSGRGIRQGDLMSPYLFTLVMEIFIGILNERFRTPSFKFFWRCKPTRLTRLFFANDIILFSEANVASTTLMRDGLQVFSSWLGLKSNHSKSEIFFLSRSLDLREVIRQSFGFNKDKLPFCYLGVPVIASRLSKIVAP